MTWLKTSRITDMRNVNVFPGNHPCQCLPFMHGLHVGMVNPIGQLLQLCQAIAQFLIQIVYVFGGRIVL